MRKMKRSNRWKVIRQYTEAGWERLLKKSRFIAEVYPIESEEQAAQILEETRKNIGMQDITAGHMFLEEIQLLRE